MVYQPKTDEEIKTLALDLFQTKIFIATMIKQDQQEHLIPMIFMPIAFADKKLIDELLRVDGIPYEYMDEAAPRSINGYPCFFSMHYLSRTDYKRVWHKLQEIKAAVENT